MLLDKLGSGGMGVVYRARDESTGRIVAFKQLTSSTAGSRRATAEALFEREYHTLVRLKHPRIIEVYDYGVTDSGPYYTMELLDGTDLAGLAPIAYRDACRLLRDVASSLALIHAHRLLHRDITSRNVRLTADGHAKLIDFGALAGFGRCTNIVGTPVCVAPEAFNQLPLDQRTDVFALGALAYYVLTGRHAYPARRLPDLPATWQKPPAPPSQLAPDVPPALDALVLSMVALDPLARPSNAAVVIDELTAIGKLPPEEFDNDGDSYLLSGRLVGRHSEMQWLERRVERVLGQKGAEVLIEGGSGIGKTRLLHEIGLEAQVKGLLVVKADGQATPELFGVASALALNLLNTGAEEVRPAAESHSSLLGHLSPVLHERLGRPNLVTLSEDAGERRARFQAALHEWFLDVAKHRGVLVAVDNIQAADENSVAFLAALGRSSPKCGLFVLATQRSGDPVVARAPLRDFRRRSGQLKLAGLDREACEDLVRSLFGDVANTGRVAKLLFERSAGNPQILMDLAQHLVRSHIVKYVGGTWVLPLGVSPDEVPIRIESLIAARLAVLSVRARELAEALSIYRKPVSLEHCLVIAGRGRDDETYAALDELVADQILIADGPSYRFAQQTVREAILQRLDSATRRGYHLLAADAILASADNDGALLDAAWHLLDAGEEGRGAELLASAGGRFIRDGGGDQAGTELVKAFDTTLAVYDRQDRPIHEKTAVLFGLVGVAYFNDWQMVLKHGERAVRLGLRITGLELAERLRRFAGRWLALAVALVIAAVRFRRATKRGLDWDFKEAIGSCCAIIPATIGTHNICYDIDTVERLAKTTSALRMFGKKHVATLMHDFAVVQLYMGQSREHEALELLERLLDQFQDPKMAEIMGESSHKAILGGVLYSQGILYAYQVGDPALEIARKLEALGIRVYAMAADQVRLLHHALRGECEEVQRYRDRVELYAVQGNTTWQAENFWPVLLLAGEVLCGDTIAVRRIAEQLERRAKELPSLAVYADAAKAAYLSLRGDLEAAIALYETVLPQLGVRRRVAWLSVRAFYADALNRAGEHTRAKEVLLEALSTMLPGEDEIVSRFLEPQRQLALAEAGLGNHARAVQSLDDLLTRWGDRDQPLLIGLLHKARAEVALLVSDPDAFEAHFARMGACFTATRNPALVAQLERLGERAMRGGVRENAGPLDPVDRLTTSNGVTRADRRLSELSAVPDACEYALGLIVERSRAKAGHLYLFEGDGMSLAAATVPHEPPEGLETDLLQAARRVELGMEDGEVTEAMPAESGITERETTAFLESIPPTPPVRSHQYVLLISARSGMPRVVGGVILEVGSEFVPVEFDYLESIARILAERGARSGGAPR